MKTDIRYKLLSTLILSAFFVSKIILILKDNCGLLMTWIQFDCFHEVLCGMSEYLIQDVKNIPKCHNNYITAGN